MRRAVKIMAIVQVLLMVAITAALIFDDGARIWLVRLFRGVEGADTAPYSGHAAISEGSGRSGGAADAATEPVKANHTALVDESAMRQLLKAGRVDEAEVQRRAAEIEELKRRTIEVKRAEEERRIGEVADWFDRLMAHHPESGQKAREILDEYIELRYRTYGDMEDIDPEYARAQRENVRQRVGQRLLSELPPAQGATVMKRLFI